MELFVSVAGKYFHRTTTKPLTSPTVSMTSDMDATFRQIMQTTSSLLFTVHGFSTVVPKITTTSQTDDSTTERVPGKMRTLNELFIIFFYDQKLDRMLVVLWLG